MFLPFLLQPPAALAHLQAPTVATPELVGFAFLPAATFRAGTPSGSLLTPGPLSNNAPVPFPNQPVQGVSAAIREPSGSYLLLSDNGFGRRTNSADAELCIYRARLDFRRSSGGSGEVTVVDTIVLRDPHRHAGQRIVADLTHYPESFSGSFPGKLSDRPVPSRVRDERILTGADFDPESFQYAPDGTFWVGDEFGPFLLHFGADGILLEPPLSIPVPPELRGFSRGAEFFRSPDHPELVQLENVLDRTHRANIRVSKGVEGLAITPDGTKLIVMLEGPLVDDPDQHKLALREFDIERRTFTDRCWYYRLERPIQPSETPSPRNTKIGELCCLDEHTFVVVETDDGQGRDAWCKKLFRVDLREQEQGILRKVAVADLLAIANPHKLEVGPGVEWHSEGATFQMPHFCIESIVLLDPSTLLIINDNNYPTTGGVARIPGASDGTEFCLVKLPESTIK